MPELQIGYARVSTDAQDLTAQRDGLQALSVEPERIYVDHGRPGPRRGGPGLGGGLAACRAGDTLVITKLDRLARSLPDARDIADELTRRNVRLNLGGSVYDPTDPVGRLLFNVLAMVAEFEADLVRARARRHEGRQGQRPTAGQAAQAEPEAGDAPGGALSRRRAHRQRAGGALRRHTLDCLSRGPARRRTGVRRRGGVAASHAQLGPRPRRLARAEPLSSQSVSRRWSSRAPDRSAPVSRAPSSTLPSSALSGSASPGTAGGRGARGGWERLAAGMAGAY